MLNRLWGILIFTSLALGMGYVLADQDPPTSGPYINSRGMTLPPDAAPPEKQVYEVSCWKARIRNGSGRYTK
jgi:hypothetical protein